jgi:hypothetical protein
MRWYTFGTVEFETMGWYIFGTVELRVDGIAKPSAESAEYNKGEPIIITEHISVYPFPAAELTLFTLH